MGHVEAAFRLVAAWLRWALTRRLVIDVRVRVE